MPRLNSEPLKMISFRASEEEWEAFKASVPDASKELRRLMALRRKGPVVALREVEAAVAGAERELGGQLGRVAGVEDAVLKRIPGE